MLTELCGMGTRRITGFQTKGTTTHEADERKDVGVREEE
jgi:hypothetical protein